MIAGSSSLYNESAASSKTPNRGKPIWWGDSRRCAVGLNSKGGRDIIGVPPKGAETRRGVDSARKPLSGSRAAGIPKRFDLRVVERLRVSGQPMGPNPARERRRYRIETEGCLGLSNQEHRARLDAFQRSRRENESEACPAGRPVAPLLPPRASDEFEEYTFRGLYSRELPHYDVERQRQHKRTSSAT
jgi:hypothetical protein